MEVNLINFQNKFHTIVNNYTNIKRINYIQNKITRNRNHQQVDKITSNINKLIERQYFTSQVMTYRLTTDLDTIDYKHQRKGTQITQGSTAQINQLYDKYNIKLNDQKKYTKEKRPNTSIGKKNSEESKPLQSPVKKRIRNIINRNLTKSIVPSNSKISAFSYIIMEDNYFIHSALNIKIPLEIASLTKIMTCLTILNIAGFERRKLQQIVQIGTYQTNILGTSASLQRGDKYKVQDLLYGLMLPSGNDASLALAYWGGKQIYLKQISLSVCQSKSISFIKKKSAVGLFVQEMNKIAANLDMKMTKYSNPHGLPDAENKSTAYDLSLLCNHTMKIKLFRKIVSTQYYQTSILDCKNHKKKIYWQNTHKLLSKNEYLGIKTGVTSTAGGCLASYINISNRNFTIIVLKCEQNEKKFTETENLKKWLMQKQGLTKNSRQINSND